MTSFVYKCVDPIGKSIGGSVAAEDASTAKSLLRERGLTVLEILPERKSTVKSKFALRRGITDADIYNVSKEMGILLKSGMKIDKAFDILISSSTNVKVKEELSRILKDIKSGKTAAGAFAESGRFSPLITAMISAGESIGDIKSAFENIAQHAKFQIQFKSEIRSALAYPLFLVLASLTTVLVIFKFIIPRFISIFGKNPGSSLPVTGKILFSMSNFVDFTNVYFLAVTGLIVLIFACFVNVKGLFPKIYSRFIFVPFLNKLIIYLELSRFSYSMYSMLNSGIEFIKALSLSTPVIQQARLRDFMESSAGQIKGGKSIASVFSQETLLPEIVPNMLRVGEESGNLKEIFFELHQIFDERFKNSVKTILSLLEPVVITVTGIIVGFIVISLILTVMSVGNIKL